MKNCPKCNSSDIQQLGDNFFCYSCDFDNLPKLEETKSEKVKLSLSPNETLRLWHNPLLVFNRVLTNEEILQCAEIGRFSPSCDDPNIGIIKSTWYLGRGLISEWVLHIIVTYEDNMQKFFIDNMEVTKQEFIDAGGNISNEERFPPNPDRITGIYGLNIEGSSEYITVDDIHNNIS